MKIAAKILLGVVLGLLTAAVFLWTLITIIGAALE